MNKLFGAKVSHFTKFGDIALDCSHVAGFQNQKSLQRLCMDSLDVISELVPCEQKN